MARLLRIEYPGAIYHAMARGVEGKKIFRSDKDYERFQENLEACVDAHGIRLYAFCLLRDHCHLLFETPHANLSKFMQTLQTRYAVSFNRRYRRWGHLMQGRYKAKLVEGDDYLLKLSRYIHLNPVMTRPMGEGPINERRKALRAYRWSSYRSYIGVCKPLKYVEYGPLRAQIPDPDRNRKRAYRRYVEFDLVEEDKEWLKEMKRSSLAIGSEQFLERVEELYWDMAEGARIKEDVAFRRMGRRLEAGEISKVVLNELGIDETELRARRGGGLYRAVMARMLIKYAGWNQRTVAGHFSIGSGAAISLGLKKLGEVMGESKKLTRSAKRIEHALNEKLKT